MIQREKCPFKLSNSGKQPQKVMKFSSWSFQGGTENIVHNFGQLIWILNDVGFTQMFVSYGWFWLIFRSRLRYPEAEFSDVIGTKNIKSFSPCYSQSHLWTDFNSPPPQKNNKWFETGLYCKHCILKPQVWELSRLWSETSTKLYVHEFGFYTAVSWWLNVQWLSKASTF
jgi:hypothetical protein